MGRFCAAVLFLAACGDNFGASSDDGLVRTSAGGHITPITETDPPAAVPAVCGSSSFSVPVTNPKEATVAIGAIHGISNAFTVEGATPGVTALAFDTNLKLLASRHVLDKQFISVKGSAIDDHSFAVGFDGGAIAVEMFDQPLENPRLLAAATATAQGQVMQLGTNRVVAYGTDKGLAVMPFTSDWQPKPEIVVGPSSTISELSLAQNGPGEILAAWMTTDKQCYVQRIDKLQLGTPVVSAQACEHVQVAGNYLGQGRVIFTTPEHELRMMPVTSQMDSGSILLRTDVYAPKVSFDGARYWIAYTNQRQQVIVGFLEDKSSFVTMALPDLLIDATSSFDMTVIDAAVPYVVSVDPVNGYQANKLCLR